MISLSLSSKTAIASVPIQRSPLTHRRPALRCAPRAGVSKYLAEAASQIFSPMTDEVPWERVADSFTGKIKHHEEVSRLRHLIDEVKAAREHLEATVIEAATDEAPIAVSPASVTGDYVTSSISRIFDNNFTGDVSEPATYFASVGYRARGRTQREVRREIDRLSRFERVVKSAIETAEVNA